MITLTLQAKDPAELAAQLAAMLGGVEPESQVDALKRAVSGTTAAEVRETPTDGVTVPKPVEQEVIPPEPKKNSRAKKAPAPNTVVPDPNDLTPPAFLDRRPSAQPAAAEPADTTVYTEKDLLDAMNAVIKKLGFEPARDKMQALLKDFKAADGTVATKRSHVQPKDFPAVMAGMRALVA